MTTVHDEAHYESQRDALPPAQQELALPRDVYDGVRQHGEETYPHECCGILLGQVGESAITVRQALRAGNTRLDSARNRYNIEPADLIRAQREGRAQGLDIVGFYHSHPDHPAFPSTTDLVEAHWFGCAYVITSIEGQGDRVQAHTTNSFLLGGTDEDSKAFQKQTVTVLHL